MLVSYASHHIQHMQKAMEQMNIKLNQVVRDSTGVTGMGIIRAIISGERNPKKLVTFKSCGLFKKLIKSRSHSKVMLENKNQKERDRDETKNYYNTSV